MTYIRKMCLTILALLMIAVSVAEAAEVEIVYNNVNFRKAPGGQVICRFAGGEVLTALEEVWEKNQLWYRAVSDAHGEGYVSAVYARPVYQDHLWYNNEGMADADGVLTENMLAFLEDWISMHFEFGYCYWDGTYDIRRYPAMNEAERKEKNTPECRIRLAELLFRHGLIWETGDHALLTDPEKSEEEKAAVASKILKAHYGTDDIYTIILSCYGVGFPKSDWHFGDPPYTSELANRKSEERIAKVESRYGRKEPVSDSAETDGNTVLYFNPSGGTRYHLDPDCPSMNPKYLPMTSCFLFSEANDPQYAAYRPCNVCDAPLRSDP